MWTLRYSYGGRAFATRSVFHLNRFLHSDATDLTLCASAPFLTLRTLRPTVPSSAQASKIYLTCAMQHSLNYPNGCSLSLVPETKEVSIRRLGGKRNARWQERELDLRNALSGQFLRLQTRPNARAISFRESAGQSHLPRTSRQWEKHILPSRLSSFIALPPTAPTDLFQAWMTGTRNRRASL